MHPFVMQAYVAERHQRLVVDAHNRRLRRRARAQARARLGRLLLVAGQRLARQPGDCPTPRPLAPSSP